MNDKEFDNFIREAMKYEDEKLQDIINNEPSLADVKAPDDLHDRLFAQIREYEEERARIKEKEELENLKKKYKRSKRWNKVIVLIAAIVCVLALGVTSMGGPKRVLQKVTWMLGDEEKTNIDTDDEQVENQGGSTEAEAYEELERAFGVFPARLYYLPGDMKFTNMILDEATQNARLFYEHKNGMTISYTIFFNYRAESIGTQFEDELINKYEKEVDGVKVLVEEYKVEDSNTTRWKVEFQHSNEYYYLVMTKINADEVEKIVENLYFFE